MQPSTSEVIGQCTDPYRGCIVSTTVPSRLRALECRLWFDISILVAYLLAHRDVQSVRVCVVAIVQSQQWWSIRIMMLNKRETKNIIKNRKKEDIFVRRASNGKNATATLKRFPKAEVRKEKKGDERRCQKYLTHSLHERRCAVPIPNVVQTNVSRVEIKFIRINLDLLTIGDERLIENRIEKISEFVIVWSSIEIVSRGEYIITLII